jgi:hypothetical protein
MNNNSRFALAATALFVAPAVALADDIDQLQNLLQGEFRLLSEDLGAALSFKPLIPSEAMGITGFDIGVAVTGTKLKNRAIFDRASSGDSPTWLPVPTIRVHKGLPLNIDIGLLYSQVPGTNIKYTGGELRWAILPGSTAIPAVALRGTLTKVSGVDQLDFDTKSVDISVSKGFVNLTPYGGIGTVWVNSTPKGVPSLRGEEFNMTKVFAGLNVNFGVGNLAFEADNTGGITSVGAKFGWRF